jgi:hypothetical protein
MSIPGKTAGRGDGLAAFVRPDNVKQYLWGTYTSITFGRRAAITTFYHPAVLSLAIKASEDLRK